MSPKGVPGIEVPRQGNADADTTERGRKGEENRSEGGVSWV